MDNKRRLDHYSLRIAGNRWDADDLAQEAWLKLAEALRQQPDRPVTGAFLYRIASNAWIDMQRKRQTRTVPFGPEHEAAAPVRCCPAGSCWSSSQNGWHRRQP